MNGLPLHPSVVHFPIVLSILLPLVAIGAFLFVRRQRSTRVWMLPLAFAAALSASAWVAIRTGEGEEEKVESVVSEGSIHEHEEAAEQFLWLSLLVLGVTAVGLLRGGIGTAARSAAVAGALVLVFAGYRVGSAGGELVYRHNAGSAYASAASVGGGEGGEGAGAAGATSDTDSDR